MSSAAQQFSEWLEETHPVLFGAVYQRAVQQRNASVLAKARLMGYLGQDESDDISDILVDTAPTEIDVSDATNLPTLTANDLQPVSSPIASVDSGSLSPSSDQSSGFLQTIGSGISTAAGSVASFLTSSQGLSDLTKLGSAYFALQNNKVNAQLQTQVLQAQLSRVSAGQSPSPITYAMVNGQLTPVYVSSALPVTSTGAVVAPSTMPPSLLSAIASGQSQLVSLANGSTGYVVPGNMIGGLASNATLQQMFPWLLLIGGGLLLLHSLRR